MVLERTYIIPLRREWIKTPRWRRTKKAVAAIRKFLARHMKSSDVRLGKYLNLELWKHGMQNPPGKIKVNAVKDDKGVVRVELFGAPVEEPKPKEEEKKGLAQKIAEKIAGKKEEKEIKKEAELEAKKGEEKIAAELKRLEDKTKAIKEKEEKKALQAKKIKDKSKEEKQEVNKEKKKVEEKKVEKAGVSGVSAKA